MLLVIGSFFTACSKTDTAIPAAYRAASPVPEGASSQAAPKSSLSASCIFIEGIVELGRSGTWETVEIGDAVEAGDTIRTAADGSCELQFGTMAILKLQPSTTLVVNGIFLSDAASSVDASLEIGALLNKVQKLAGSDSYIIRTGTSICGVRGTDFIVSTDGKTGTTIAVRNGRVAVVAASAIIDKLLAASSSNAIAGAAIQAIVAVAPVVGGNQEITIDSNSVDRAEAVYKEILAEVNSLPPVIPASGSSTTMIAPPLIQYSGPDGTDGISMPVTASAEAANLVKAIVKKANGSLRSGAKIPLPASRSSVEKLKGLDGIRAMPLSSTGTVSDPYTPVTMALTQSAEEASGSASVSVAATSPVPATSGNGNKGGPGVSWQALRKAVMGGVVRVPSTGSFIVSDADGNLSSVSESGKILWTLKTANKAAERSYAVPFKGLVYYSGSDEFLIIDAVSGTVLSRVALEGKRSHMLGNRVVPFPNALVFPTRDGLEVLSERTGETIRVIPVSGGTNMSPANYEGLAAIVSQKGVFMLIDIETGEIKTEIKTSAVQPVAQAPRIVGTRACFADRKGLLVMVDLATNSLAWEKSLSDSGGIFADVEMGQAGVFAYGKKKLFSYSLDGVEITAPFGGVSAPPLLSKGILYYGTENGFLVAFDVKAKIETGRIALGSKMTARPLFVDGFIFAGTENGRIVKVDASLF